MSNMGFNRTLIRAHRETGKFAFHCNGSVGEKAPDIFLLCPFFALHCVCSVTSVHDGLLHHEQFSNSSLASNLVWLESLFRSLSDDVPFVRVVRRLDERHKGDVGDVPRKMCQISFPLKNNSGYSPGGIDSIFFVLFGGLNDSSPSVRWMFYLLYKARSLRSGWKNDMQPQQPYVCKRIYVAAVSNNKDKFF